MPGVKIIEELALYMCENLTHVEFDKLETIGGNAFTGCTTLQRVKLPKVKSIGFNAFMNSGVEELEFGEELETIGRGAFWGSKLRRIAIPLKNEMVQLDDLVEAYNQFRGCNNLTTVDLVGGIQKTVASLHLESWRNEIHAEIQRINQILPDTDPNEKSAEIAQWIRTVIIRIYIYKAEHRELLKKATTLLELALWKAKLADFTADDDKKCSAVSVATSTAKKAKIDVGEARKEARITSGANIIIKNVLPYLKME